MVQTALVLAEETSSSAALTFSDEISLVLVPAGQDSQVYFSGRRDKINSVLASLAAVTFNRWCPNCMPENNLFDCRCWNVPNLTEATNMLLWREMDATRNSIHMAARAVFSHNQCKNLSSAELQELLFSKAGINWNDYEIWQKRGTYVLRTRRSRVLSDAELGKIPEKYRPTGPVIRSSQEVAYFSEPLAGIENREAVLFSGMCLGDSACGGLELE
jgi:tRNA(His) 5'-end guanylyltransferase